MKKDYDYLIVGSGLFGATFANRAKSVDDKCLVIDKRPHLGGNLYCEDIEGINVHKYGPHIFHTSNRVVWNFVNDVVKFNNFINSPLASYRGKLYNLPFNLNTFYQMWGVTTPEKAIEIIEHQKAEAAAKMRRDGVTQPRNLEEQAQMLVGNDIYERLIKEYTEKQWGRKCSELPPSIIKRLPVRFVFDNNYYDDEHQGIPIGGYNKLIDGLLDGIETKTNADFFDNREYWEGIAEKIVFTGKIDEFYGYRFGKLNYRTVLFEQETIDTPNYQGNAIVNYTEQKIPFTRIIEHKHFEMFGKAVYSCPKTVVSREYPTEWTEGMESYYPINDETNNKLYSKYKALADKETNVIFGGRLAEYKYYDMDDVIKSALDAYKKELLRYEKRDFIG